MSDPFAGYAGSPQGQLPGTTAPPPPPPAAESNSNSNPNSNPQSPQERHNSNGAVPHGLNARSCVTCRRRKVKCDKLVPCSNCTKAKTQCVFPAPGRAPRRPRVGGPKVVTEREAELLKRLRRLEGVVEELSGQVEVEGIKHSPESDQSSSMQKDSSDSAADVGKVRVVGMDEGSGTTKNWITRSFNLGAGPPKPTFKMESALGRLTLDEGKSRYVSNPFWASITEEVEEIREIMEGQDYESDEELPARPSDVVTEANHQSFIMGYSSCDVNIRSLHPLPSQIPFYWQTFLENVNPLVKIFHTETMNKVIKEVQSNLDSLSRSTEALMFSIYFATVTSLSPEEVKANFGIEKAYLVKQYRFGAEQALARAGFLNTSEIVTVQAFVLFLVCVRRHDDTRFVWALTGLAIRIAQSLGLHRDGTKFGLSPFDTEMRRRLWWQVCILDVRASEDHGSDPSIMDPSFDTEQPLNINDADLDPNATEPPTPRIGVSEMTFCLIRYEICSLSRRLSYTPPGPGPCRQSAQSWTLEDKERMIKETADKLEDKYLQYCENAGPLYWVSATVARLITAKMSLIVYHPFTQPGKPTSLSQDVKDRLFMASIEIMEYSQRLESEISTKQWGWLFHTYIQWHAIAYILGELSCRPQSIIVERAWRAMDVVFSEWDGAVFKTKTGLLWQPMRKLLARARRKREENLANHQTGLTLGMDSKYIRPPPSGAVPTRTPNIAQDRVRSLTSPAIIQLPLQQPHQSIVSAQQYRTTSYTNGEVMEPQQMTGMGMHYSQDQMQQQLLQQQYPAQPTPWLMDETSLLDLEMQGLEEDINWEGWDDLVKDFKMETDMQMQLTTEGRPSTMGTGTWW